MTNPPEDGDQRPAEHPVHEPPGYESPVYRPYEPPQPQYGRPAYGHQPYGQGYAQQQSSGHLGSGPPGYGSQAWPGYGQQPYGQPYAQPGPGWGRQPYQGQPYAAPGYAPPGYGQLPYGQTPYGQAPYPPGAYGTPPEKKKRRTGLIAGLIGAVAVIAAVVVVLSMTLGGKVLDRAAVQRDVAQQFEQHQGVAVQLTCDSNMKLVQGATYACRGTTADGESVRLQIKVTDAAKADYTWSERG